MKWSSMNVSIQPVTPLLLPQLADLETRCFSVPWTRQMFEEELQCDYARYFAAVEEGGGLVGYAGLHAILDEGYITNVAVRPDCRRQGVGGALLARLLSVSRENQLSFLTLEVRDGNLAARSLYRKFGFQEVGRRKNYYTKPREDAVLMTRIFPPPPPSGGRV